MGTGVGEAALAAEAIGAAEAATAAGAAFDATTLAAIGQGAGDIAAGQLASGLAGVAGLAGEVGAGYGGLGSLAPTLQQSINATAAFNPEIAAQTAQFANMGSLPPANATFGWNPADLATVGQGAGDIAAQSLNPASLAQQFGSGIQNLDPTKFEILDAAQTADITSHISPEFMNSYLPDATQGRGLYDLGATDMSLGAAGQANAAAAATPSITQAAGAAFDPSTMATINQGAGDIVAKPGFDLTRPFSSAYNLYKQQDKPTQYGLAGLGAMQAAKYLNKPQGVAAPEKYSGPLSKFSYSPDTYTPYTYKPYAAGGPVEEMSRENAIGANTGYPQSDIQQGAYATPWQTPVSRNVVANAGDVGVDQMTGMERMAGGGIANLGGYSDGGRLLKGPGDGMSDNIPATIGSKQPARLADGEFVVPADVVSGLGNGSTEAGAKQLYKMLDKVRSARTGTKKQGKQIKPEKYTPA